LATKRRGFALFVSFGQGDGFGFLIGFPLTQDDVNTFQHRMINRDNRSLGASSGLESVIFVSEMTVFFLSGGPCALGQCTE
jgi:hypothetical protein